MATANNIRDIGARYVATSFSISPERSLIQTGRATTTFLRLQLGTCSSGVDAIVVVVIAGTLLICAAMILLFSSWLGVGFEAGLRCLVF
jgi:hypothetical protein